MNELIAFSFQGNQVRTILRDGDPWWIAKDVCGVLGIANPSDAVRSLDLDERHTLDNAEGISRDARAQQIAIISEPGLYSLILRSRKPEAHAFKRWIIHEVLPAIRKTGRYDPSQLSRLDILEMAVDSEKARIVLQEKVEELKPKAEAHDQFLSARNTQDMNTVAKALGWGRKRLFQFLRKQGILMSNNLPYQKYIEQCYFTTREVPKPIGNVSQTLVTAKGMDFIAKLVREKYLLLDVNLS